MQLMLGAAIGASVAVFCLAIVWPALRRLVAAVLVGRLMTARPLPMPYHTFLESEPRKLLGDGSRLLSSALDDKLVRKINGRLRRANALHLQTARRGLRSSAEAAEYLRRTGLAGEMGLAAGEISPQLQALEDPELQLSPASEYSELHVGEPPPGPVRCPAEFEGAGAVVVSWPIYYPWCWSVHCQLVGAISSEALALVLVPSESWRQAVELYCRRNMTDMQRVRFIVAQTDDVWTRDYGPTAVLTGESGAPALVSNPYVLEYQSYMKHDADAAHKVARYLGVPEYRLPLVIEGGNLTSDGAGTFAMMSSVIDNNPDVDEEMLRTILKEYLGCTRLLLLRRHRGEPTGHVDMTVKFIDARTALVASAAHGHPWREDFDAAADTLSKTPSSSGQPYQVLRVAIPAATPSPFHVWGYTNSLVLGHTAVVPVFGAPEDAAALDVYRAALPTHTVFSVDFSAYPLGAAHCQTKELPSAHLPQDLRARPR